MTSSYLRFWGVRGSYPAPFSTHLGTGGNTSCVEIRVGDHLLICDAGTGVIPLGNLLMEQDEVREITVILTHYHWDHINGLPFFLPAFTPGWRINFFGPGEERAEIEKHIADQMRAPYFPVETETWLADINYMEPRDGSFRYGPIEIEYFNVHHPGSTYGYRIGASGRSIVYASDNELAFINHSIERRKAEFDARERQLLEAMKEEQHWRAVEFMEDVDFLIHDAQYTPEDYARKRGWGHSCYIDTVRAAVDARAKNLYLFHLDPNYDDDFVAGLHRHSLEIIHERGSHIACHVAREGDVIDLAGD